MDRIIVWRTVLFFIGWISFTIALGILALPTLLSRQATWIAARFWVKISLFWLRISCSITSEARGLEHLGGARIIASKHQSAWDTLMLWSLLKNPVFVLKRELYWIPIFGWYLWRTGQIGINRRKPKGAIERIAASMEVYGEQGRTLVIFPEGTRIPPGKTRAFHAGIARISAAMQQPVVPAVLNAGLFWPKCPLWKRPGHAVIEFLPPLPASPADDFKPWIAELERVINGATERLEVLGVRF
jgi:1-acyl-sn-glycerol-3-phosphate acyltransferase